MRWSILLAVAFLAHSLSATPIPSPSARLAVDKTPTSESVPQAIATPEATSKEVETGRQSTAENQVDDDDDDDDDEELDLDIEDDDDDDDDDDEDPAPAANASPAAGAAAPAQAAPAASSDDDDDDDDEGDYFERLFDDFLGDDDDDDDDDDDTPAKPAAAAAVASNPAAAAAAAPAAAAAATPAAGPSPQGLSATDVNDDGIGDYNNNEEASSLEYEQGAEDAAAAASSVAENAAAVEDVSTGAVADEAAAAGAAAAVAATTSDDDDDDDDDDDVGVDDLVEDDDDDDDDDDDEDDDDDDDVETDLDDVVDDEAIEAKRSRAMSSASMGGTGPTGIPTSAYIAKYNRFVDTIMDRVNKILRRSYDPVNVRLQPAQQKKTASGNKKKRKTHQQQRQQSELILDSASHPVSTVTPSNGTTANVTSSHPVAQPATRKDRAKKANKKGSKKPQTRPAHTRAKATLYGLSSIKRSGDVTVNMMSTHTTVKTNFLVGPLTLKVEKEFGRGAKKELRSATATTAEMTGRLNLRVVPGGAATLHSIKVMQPKQVRMEAADGVPTSSQQVQVDSSDDHDRTREFLWSKSSHIARLVSQKLTSATKSMLRPPASKNEAKEASTAQASQASQASQALLASQDSPSTPNLNATVPTVNLTPTATPLVVTAA